MKKPRYAVAVVGAELIGREIITALDERGFPVGVLRWFGDRYAEGDECEFNGRAVPAEQLGSDVGSPDLIFVTGEGAVPDVHVGAASVMVDSSGRWALDDAVPLVVPECNPQALAGYRARRLVASPDPIAVALAAALAPLCQHVGLRRVVATTFEPASVAGAGGIDELSHQTVELLNGRSVSPSVFSSRLSFNLIPTVGSVGVSGSTDAEERAAAHLRKILGMPDLRLHISRMWVPVFYGASASVCVELDGPLHADAASEMFRDAPGILWRGGDDGDPSAADVVGQDATIVGRLRSDASVPHGLAFWVAIDNMRKGTAVNAVQIAELLIRDYL